MSNPSVELAFYVTASARRRRRVGPTAGGARPWMTGRKQLLELVRIAITDRQEIAS